MKPLKHKISPRLVACIGGHLARHIGGFDRRAFESAILADLSSLELKQRGLLIADHLHRVLPADPTARYAVIRAMLHPDDDAGTVRQSDHDGICGWGMMPLCAVVGRHGLADFEGSLSLLREMTKRFSSEFDVRYFLLADQVRALKIIGGWVSDPNRHVRRLVSEGTRPRLPWAMRIPALVADPAPILPLLEALRDDPDDYVRRSVANNLNDIAKDHPGLVATLTKTWLRGASAERKRLLRHASRTLIKQGHPAALQAFGLGPPQIELVRFALAARSVTLGGALVFAVDLRSIAASAQPLVIDYVLHFKKANGALSAKVFKWKTLRLAPGESAAMKRAHPIRVITTRRYYAGEQALSLRINGKDFGYATFTLRLGDGKA
jgi:3-methyladenine DNA glycosylase AlkC